MAGRYYITTSIAYVNAKPHIGFALEVTQSDCFARYHRLRGEDTYFLTGTDENALKNVQAAEAEGVPVQELVARNSQRFRDLQSHLDLSYDQFIRTASDPRHAPGSQKLWTACDLAGDIYKKHYRGLYCVRCEKFLDEDDMVDGLCSIHLIPPEEVEEENYFFRLSRYADQLHELIATDRYRVIPETRKNEVLSFISRGLQDFSISRSQERARGWGVPVPGDPTQVMYVWFDALSNYITALDYADDGDLYEKYWVQNPHRVHCVGKDIIRFHAIYWPAMLLSAGVPLPEALFVHGFINLGGTKVSKSLGNVVDPFEMVREYGQDAVRYFLLRGINPTIDTDFTLKSFEARYNADLANDLGNLAQRSLSMIARNCGGAMPQPGALSSNDQAILRSADSMISAARSAMATQQLHQVLNTAWGVVAEANRYFAGEAPWSLAKTDPQRMGTVLYVTAEVTRQIAILAQPFMPSACAKLLDILGVPANEREFATLGGEHRIAAGTKLPAPTPVFPRYVEAEAGRAS
jgi:methionyl-tRNA synthetase